ncbi:hypothetical protein H5410_001580, partial [Solanum commersonii]
GASNSNAIGQTQTVESKVKKERKKISHVWDHFTHKIDHDGSEMDVSNYCKKKYFADTKEHGTTSMLSHITKCQKMPYNIVIKQSRLAFQPVIGECRKALCRMVILDELPFKFVENKGFKQFMKVAQPCLYIPSRTTNYQLLSNPSHRGEDLKKSISKCLHDWGLHRIFTVTVDNKFIKLCLLESIDMKIAGS